MIVLLLEPKGYNALIGVPLNIGNCELTIHFPLRSIQLI